MICEDKVKRFNRIRIYINTNSTIITNIHEDNMNSQNKMNDLMSEIVKKL